MNRRAVLLGGTAAAATIGVPPVGAQQPRRPANISQTTDIVTWLKANAIPIATVAPGRGYADLEPLRAAIAKVRVVSLGEATHGTREFFQLKHRMMEYCIAELGFTVIGFEADYGATLAVNDYVLAGRGSAADVAAGMGFWTWNTDEVIDLVEWVRAWNTKHERKVKFYGFDMQSSAASALHLLAYLERVSPALAAKSELVLGVLACPSTALGLGGLAQAEHEAIFAQIKAIQDEFQAERASWTNRTSALDWHLARLSAVVIEQYVHTTVIEGPGPRYAFRDRCMAANILALLEAEAPNARALLWAHNGHVQKAFAFPRIPSMGNLLHAELGSQLLVFGFAFNQGSFSARGVVNNELRDWVVGPAPDNFIEARLAATGLLLLALDLRQVPPESAVAAWMAKNPYQRSIGAAFDPAREFDLAKAADPRENWDILLFVETTTAARRTRTRKRAQPVGMGVHEEPTNLELSGVGGFPTGWQAANLSEAPGPSSVSITELGPPGDGNAVGIASQPATLPWGAVTLSQIFSAVRWRNRRMVFTAAMRAQVSRLGTGAYAMVQVFGDAESQPLVAVQPAGPVRSSDWTRRSVAVDIPSEAKWIEISVLLAGSGSALFGGLELATEAVLSHNPRLQFLTREQSRDQQLVAPGRMETPVPTDR